MSISCCVADASESDYFDNFQSRMQCFILLFDSSNRFLLINCLYVDDAHVVCQHLKRSSHYVCRWSDASRKNLVDYHALFNLLCSCHHLHILARQTTRRQHIALRLFSSLQTFHQLLCLSTLRFSLFFCSLILNITLLSLLIFFSWRCWLMLLYVAMMTIVSSTLCMLSVFVTIA